MRRARSKACAGTIWHSLVRSRAEARRAPLGSTAGVHDELSWASAARNEPRISDHGPGIEGGQGHFRHELRRHSNALRGHAAERRVVALEPDFTDLRTG